MIGGIIQALFITLNVVNARKETFLIHMDDTAAGLRPRHMLSDDDLLKTLGGNESGRS